jgi:hypothetical protein
MVDKSKSEVPRWTSTLNVTHLFAVYCNTWIVKVFVLPESGKQYGLYECMCAMMNRFELCEMGTKSCYKQSFSRTPDCNAYKVE